MSATFDVRNGVANTNDLKAALDVGTMAANGSVNLVNEALAMHLTAVLSQAYSQSVGGTGVGGYLNTALGNKNGELVLPVIVTGTMSHPTVMPDVQKLAEMKLNNIIPNAAGILGGKGGAGGIVGALLGGGNQQQGQQAQPAGKQAQPTQQQQLQDALGGLFGGKKKPETVDCALASPNKKPPRGAACFHANSPRYRSVPANPAPAFPGTRCSGASTAPPLVAWD